MKKSPRNKYFEYPLVFDSKHPSTLYGSYPHITIVGTTPEKLTLKTKTFVATPLQRLLTEMGCLGLPPQAKEETGQSFRYRYAQDPDLTILHYSSLGQAYTERVFGIPK